MLSASVITDDVGHLATVGFASFLHCRVPAPSCRTLMGWVVLSGILALEARVGGWEWDVGKMGEGGRKVQTSSCKINKSWGSYVQHGDYG